MTPEAILSDLLSCGIAPGLTPDSTGIVVPAGGLTDAQRTAVLTHKAELIEYLRQASRITSQALTAAMSACDQWGDSPAAREQMRRDVLATPPHLMADLLEHLQQAYRGRGSFLEGCRTGNSHPARSLHTTAA